MSSISGVGVHIRYCTCLVAAAEFSASSRVVGRLMSNSKVASLNSVYTLEHLHKIGTLEAGGRRGLGLKLRSIPYLTKTVNEKTLFNQN